MTDYDKIEKLYWDLAGNRLNNKVEFKHFLSSIELNSEIAFLKWYIEELNIFQKIYPGNKWDLVTVNVQDFYLNNFPNVIIELKYSYNSPKNKIYTWFNNLNQLEAFERICSTLKENKAASISQFELEILERIINDLHLIVERKSMIDKVTNLSDPDNIIKIIGKLFKLIQLGSLNTKRILQNYFAFLDFNNPKTIEVINYILESTNDSSFILVETKYEVGNYNDLIKCQEFKKNITELIDAKKYQVKSISDNQKPIQTQLELLKNKLILFQKEIRGIQKDIEQIKKFEFLSNLTEINRIRFILEKEPNIFSYPEIYFHNYKVWLEQLNSTERKILKEKLKTARKGVLNKIKKELSI
jgi:hypothetical protein